MRPIPVTAEFEQAAELALARSGWFARAGVPTFPLSKRAVIHLLRVGGEYDVDAARLDDLVARGVVTPPDGGAWSAGDVVQAGAVLEARRQWAATPSLHDAKKHPALLALEQAAAADTLAECLDGSPRLDARHLLVLLVEADNREMREKLLAGVLAELHHAHGVRL